MNIPDNQYIATCWNDKPIGLVRGVLSKPTMFDGEISIVGWHGEILGKEIEEQSPNELYRCARTIAKEKGLRHIWMKPLSGAVTLYTPAFEE